MIVSKQFASFLGLWRPWHGMRTNCASEERFEKPRVRKGGMEGGREATAERRGLSRTRTCALWSPVSTKRQSCWFHQSLTALGGAVGDELGDRDPPVRDAGLDCMRCNQPLTSSRIHSPFLRLGSCWLVQRSGSLQHAPPHELILVGDISVLGVALVFGFVLAVRAGIAVLHRFAP
jgi:hypothetical protein